MHKLLRFAAILFSSIILAEGNAQQLHESDIPVPVKSKLTSMYPGIKNVKWEKQNGNIEAEFKASQVQTSVLFNPDGTYIQTEIEIPVRELPKATNEYVIRNMSGKKIKEASRITDAKGTVTYEAEVGGEDFLFDANGIFLKKIEEESDKEDED